jgi:hypothetical protein
MDMAALKFAKLDDGTMEFTRLQNGKRPV